jgi:TonB family protein
MRILLAFGLLASIASAQIPDAPLPASPSATEAKPSLQLPNAKYEVPQHRAPSKAKEFCYAPATGLFAINLQTNLQLKGSIGGEMRNYRQLLLDVTIRDWASQLTYGDKMAAHHGHIPAVRFVINADGSHSAPELARSSGRDSLDAKALETIRRHVMFDPLPVSFPKPFPVCILYGYGVTLDTLLPLYYGSWQTPETP